MSERTTRLIGSYAVVAACVAVVVSPLLSLAYFATSGGVDQLENPTVSVWAVPARELAGGLLTWTSPARVYGTYWLVFWLLFAAVFLCARAVHARRPAHAGRLERWGWRMVMVSYPLGAVGGLSAIANLVDGSRHRLAPEPLPAPEHGLAPEPGVPVGPRPLLPLRQFQPRARAGARGLGHDGPAAPAARHDAAHHDAALPRRGPAGRDELSAGDEDGVPLEPL
jgi:hypothetical protein